MSRTGNPFWQEEIYDRLVRDRHEFDRIHNYIENNPVRAGLAREPGNYRWSSAGGDQEFARGPELRLTYSVK